MKQSSRPVTNMIRDEKLLLRRVARLFNVQTVHYDGLGRRIEPPPEAILSVLRVLGASAESMSDLAGALRERRQLLWRMAIDPVVVVWEGASPRIKLRLPSRLADRSASFEIAMEGGAVLKGQCENDDRVKPAERRIEGIN